MPAHDEDELVAAFAAQADAAFLSPIFATRSHPEAQAMGRERAVAIAQASPMPLFALGGMDEEKAAELEGTPFQGFGAIDAFAGEVS
nr:thiamine phosphate synthase [Parvularcula mediterranea]